MKTAVNGIPAWPVVALGNICNLVNGDAYKPQDWSKSGTPIIRIQNLNDPEKPYNHWAGSLSDRVIVKPGDLLLAWSGTPGTSFGAHVWTGEPAVLNQHIFRVDVTSDDVITGWLQLAINHQLDLLVGRAQGAVGLRHVTRDEVEALEIRLPSLGEQKLIVQTLRSAFSNIAFAVHALKKERSQLTALRRAASFDGMRIAENADDGRIVSLGGIIEVAGELVDPRLPQFADLPHIFGESIESGTGRLLHYQSARQDKIRSVKFHFRPPVLIYSKLRPYLRKAAIMSFEGLCSADAYPLRPKSPDELLLPFLQIILLSDEFTEFANRESARARMPKINLDSLMSWRFVLPSLQIQKKIVEFQSKSSDLAKQCEGALDQKVSAIASLRSALLRAAFSGQL